MKFIKYTYILFSVFFLYCCSEKTIYSGKILNDNDFNYDDIKNRTQLIKVLGEPNYSDPIEDKYVYFTEKKNFKNFFNENIEHRVIVVFSFDQNNNIQNISKFTLNDEKDINFSKDKINNNLIKRGFIEKIFGGVGKSSIPNTSQ